MNIFDRIEAALKPHVNAGVLDSALSVAIADAATVLHDEIVKVVNKAASHKAPTKATKPVENVPEKK